MQFRRTLAFVVLAAALPFACETSAPSGPESSPNPTPSTSPTPAASPTPTATPSPTPTPAGNYNEAVDVRASVTSFLRYGKLQRGRAATFIPGDVIYLTCTPLDKKGDPTKNHGRIRDWEIFSNDLVNGVDWYHTDVNTFNPDVHVSEQSHDGEIRAKCEVNVDSGSLKSGAVSMVIQKPE
jgi:hypothetical protein